MHFSLSEEQNILYNTAREFGEETIAPNAIENASKKAKLNNLDDKIIFKQSSLRDLDFEKFQEVDLVIGLGLTPYLIKDEFENLIKISNGKHYFIDFHMKGFNLQNLIDYNML